MVIVGLTWKDRIYPVIVELAERKRSLGLLD